LAVRVQVRCAVAALTLLVGGDCLATGERPADLVLTDARIYTAGPQRAMAEALAVKDGKIVFVGRASDVDSWIGPRTHVEHLAGKLVLPGLVDSHIHVLGIADLDVCNLESRPQTTLRELSAFVRACAAKYRPPPGKWLTVDEWNYAAGNQSDAEYPSLRAALDKASSTNPIHCSSGIS
jgi:predicted amidohydrolase YtcJ